jgi:hypothetical protein
VSRAPRPTPEEQADALERTLDEDDRKLLDKLAEGITRRRLTAPAIFFLESMKPLGFVASQALVFFRPVVQAVASNPVTYDRLQKILEQRGSVELLLRRLEERA